MKSSNDPSNSIDPSDELIDSALHIGELREEIEKMAGERQNSCRPIPNP